MRRTETIGACLALLAGCSTAPTPEEIAAADIGPQPAQAECEQFALRLLAEDGLTPENFRIEFAPLRRSWFRASGFAAEQFAWQLDADVEARSRSQHRTAGVGPNRFYWVHGRCVARDYYTRMFDDSRARTFVALDDADAPTGRNDAGGAAPPRPTGAPTADDNWIGVLLMRRSTLRDMRFEAEDDAGQRAAIDLLLAAVDRQLSEAGYTGR